MAPSMPIRVLACLAAVLLCLAVGAGTTSAVTPDDGVENVTSDGIEDGELTANVTDETSVDEGSVTGSEDVSDGEDTVEAEGQSQDEGGDSDGDTDGDGALETALTGSENESESESQSRSESDTDTETDTENESDDPDHTPDDSTAGEGIDGESQYDGNETLEETIDGVTNETVDSITNTTVSDGDTESNDTKAVDAEVNDTEETGAKVNDTGATGAEVNDTETPAPEDINSTDVERTAPENASTDAFDTNDSDTANETTASDSEETVTEVTTVTETTTTSQVTTTITGSDESLNMSVDESSLRAAFDEGATNSTRFSMSPERASNTTSTFESKTSTNVTVDTVRTTANGTEVTASTTGMSIRSTTTAETSTADNGSEVTRSTTTEVVQVGGETTTRVIYSSRVDGDELVTTTVDVDENGQFNASAVATAFGEESGPTDDAEQSRSETDSSSGSGSSSSFNSNSPATENSDDGPEQRPQSSEAGDTRGSTTADAALVGAMGAVTLSGAGAATSAGSAGAASASAGAGAGAGATAGTGILANLSVLLQLFWLRHLRPILMNLPWESLPISVFKYSRYDDSDPLENDRRRTIYGTIEDEPGAYLSAVSETSDVPLSTVRHHVRVLEDEGLLTSVKAHGKRRYFPADEDDVELHAALAEPAKRGVLEVLADRGRANNGDVATALDRDPSTVSHHLSTLEDDGLVVREQDGRSIVNELAPEVETRLLEGDVEADTDEPQRTAPVPADD